MTNPLLPESLGALSPYVNQGIISDMIRGPLMQGLTMTRFFLGSSPPKIFPQRVGSKLTVTRDGRYQTDSRSTPAGANAQIRTTGGEQFVIEPEQYDDKIMLDNMTAYLGIEGDSGHVKDMANFARTGAAAKIDKVAAKKSYGVYNAGHTCAIDAGVATTTIHVASINGFTEVLNSNGQIVPVGSGDGVRKYVNIAGTIRYVVAAVADDPDNSEFGPGILTLDSAHTWAANDYVIAQDAPTVIYAGGGFSVDDINGADVLTLASIQEAVEQLRADEIPEMSDGLYHAMVTPRQVTQLLTDPDIKILFNGTTLSSEEMRMGTIGIAAGVRFIRSNRVPTSITAEGELQVGVRSNSALSRQIWAETRNKDGREINRLFIYGDEAGEIHYIPPGAVWPQPWIRFHVGLPLGDHELKHQFIFYSVLDMVCPPDQKGGLTAQLDMAVLGNRNPRHKRGVTVVHA